MIAATLANSPLATRIPADAFIAPRTRGNGKRARKDVDDDDTDTDDNDIYASMPALVPRPAPDVGGVAGVANVETDPLLDPITTTVIQVPHLSQMRRIVLNFEPNPTDCANIPLRRIVIDFAAYEYTDIGDIDTGLPANAPRTVSPPPVRTTKPKSKTEPTAFCTHCDNLNRFRAADDKLPTNHWIRQSRDINSIVVCPTLSKTACTYCRALGHTQSRCPARNTARNTTIVYDTVAKLFAESAGVSAPAPTPESSTPPSPSHACFDTKPSLAKGMAAPSKLMSASPIVSTPDSLATIRSASASPTKSSYADALRLVAPVKPASRRVSPKSPSTTLVVRGKTSWADAESDDEDYDQCRE